MNLKQRLIAFQGTQLAIDQLRDCFSVSLDNSWILLVGTSVQQIVMHIFNLLDPSVYYLLRMTQSQMPPLAKLVYEDVQHLFEYLRQEYKNYLALQFEEGRCILKISHLVGNKKKSIQLSLQKQQFTQTCQKKIQLINLKEENQNLESFNSKAEIIAEKYDLANSQLKEIIEVKHKIIHKHKKQLESLKIEKLKLIKQINSQKIKNLKNKNKQNSVQKPQEVAQGSSQNSDIIIEKIIQKKKQEQKAIIFKQKNIIVQQEEQEEIYLSQKELDQEINQKTCQETEIKKVFPSKQTGQQQKDKITKTISLLQPIKSKPETNCIEIISDDDYSIFGDQVLLRVSQSLNMSYFDLLKITHIKTQIKLKKGDTNFYQIHHKKPILKKQNSMKYYMKISIKKIKDFDINLGIITEELLSKNQCHSLEGSICYVGSVGEIVNGDILAEEGVIKVSKPQKDDEIICSVDFEKNQVSFYKNRVLMGKTQLVNKMFETGVYFFFETSTKQTVIVLN